MVKLNMMNKLTYIVLELFLIGCIFIAIHRLTGDIDKGNPKL